MSRLVRVFSASNSAADPARGITGSSSFSDRWRSWETIESKVVIVVNLSSCVLFLLSFSQFYCSIASICRCVCPVETPHAKYRANLHPFEVDMRRLLMKPEHICTSLVAITIIDVMLTCIGYICIHTHGLKYERQGKVLWKQHRILVRSSIVSKSILGYIYIYC